LVRHPLGYSPARRVGGFVSGGIIVAETGDEIQHIENCGVGIVIEGRGAVVAIRD
jgi:hypothetical protein